MRALFTFLFFLPLFGYSQTALTGAQIEGAINEAVSKGRVVNVSSGSIPESGLSSLPVVFRTTIDEHTYDIVVTAMNFTAGGSTLEVGARFVPNPEMPGQVLYFNSPAIGFSAKHGFKGEMSLLPGLLSSEKNAQLSPEAVSMLAGKNKFFEVAMSGNTMVLGLDQDTRLSFNCGAFEKLTLSGYLKIFNSVNQEDSEGKSIHPELPLALVFASQTVYDWKDIFLQARVANHFHSRQIKEFGFHFESGSNALIDFSIRQNPPGLPKCGAESGNYWQGVSLGNFNLRLPGIILQKDGGKLAKVPSSGLFMDINGGLIGQAGADKLIALDKGTTSGTHPLDASLEKAYVTFGCNSKINALLSGKIKLKACAASAKEITSDYLFTFNETSGFSYMLNTKGGNTNPVTNEIKLESGASLLVEVKDNEFIVTPKVNFAPSISTTADNSSICKGYSTTLTITGCPHAVEWSNGATTATVTVSPEISTTYTARCYDLNCIQVVTNEITITVYNPLAAPQLVSSRTEEPYCAGMEARLTASVFCPGVLQWSENEGPWTSGGNTRTVSHPDLSTPRQFTYKIRCKLNDCYSDPSNRVTLNLLPRPSGPTLTKMPGGWTSCTETELHATTCNNGGILKWYRNDEYLAYMDNYLMRKETENGYYQYRVKCVTPDGCESNFSDENIHIDKCSCTPEPPAISSPYDGQTAEYGSYIPLYGRGCSGTVIWYNSGDQMVGTGADFSHVGIGGPYYYKATCKDHNGCESGFTGYIVIRVEKCTNPPAAPYAFAKIGDTVIDGNTVYEEGTTVFLQAHGCDGGTIIWYNSGGAKISNNIVHSINSVGDQYFRATCTRGANNCESELSGWVRVQIGQCVTPLPVPSVTVKGNSPFNTGTTVEIEATGCGSHAVEWYNSGNQHIGSGSKYYESATGRHFHYAKCKAANSCEGSASAMTDFTIGNCLNPPPAPVITPGSGTVTAGQTITLYASNCSGTIKWSTGDTGNQISAGAGTYTAKCVLGGCVSGVSKEVTITGGSEPCNSIAAPQLTSKANSCDYTITVSCPNNSTAHVWTGLGMEPHYVFYEGQGSVTAPGGNDVTAKCYSHVGGCWSKETRLNPGARLEPNIPSIVFEERNCSAPLVILSGCSHVGSILYENALGIKQEISSGASAQYGGTYTAFCKNGSCITQGNSLIKNFTSFNTTPVWVKTGEGPNGCYDIETDNNPCSPTLPDARTRYTNAKDKTPLPKPTGQTISSESGLYWIIDEEIKDHNLCSETGSQIWWQRKYACLKNIDTYIHHTSKWTLFHGWVHSFALPSSVLGTSSCTKIVRWEYKNLNDDNFVQYANSVSSINLKNDGWYRVLCETDCGRQIWATKLKD